MKKIFKIVVILAVFAMVLVGCKKEELAINQTTLIPIKATLVNANDMNSQILIDANKEELAKTLAKSLTNPEIRSIIKQEAMQQSDGDYDALFTNLRDKKTSKGATLNEMLVENYKAIKGKQADVSQYNKIVESISDLQFSVPVNCEKWNTSEQIPLVTYIPDNFDEKTTKFVRAFDSNGKVYLLSTSEEPEVPVIVIGSCERMDFYNSKLVPPNPLPLTPPMNFKVQPINSTVLLTWEKPNPAAKFVCHGYNIYRKGQFDNDYVNVKHLIGENSLTYYDNNIFPNENYSYYLTSYMYDEESDPTNIVNITTSNYPTPLKKFEVKLIENYKLMLTWSFSSKEIKSNAQVIIQKFNPEFDHNFVDFYTSDINVHDYIYSFDPRSFSGQTLYFKCFIKYSDNYISDPIYDFVIIPFRRYSYQNPSKVVLSKISFTDWSIESWIAGKPEFKLTIAGYDKIANQPKLIQSELKFEFDQRVNSQIFDSELFSWFPGNWFEITSYEMIEFDRGGKLDVEIGVKYANKVFDDPKWGKLDISGGAAYKYTFTDDGEKCGTTFYSYYQPANITLSFPSYGAKIELSEN